MSSNLLIYINNKKNNYSNLINLYVPINIIEQCNKLDR